MSVSTVMCGEIGAKLLNPYERGPQKGNLNLCIKRSQQGMAEQGATWGLFLLLVVLVERKIMGQQKKTWNLKECYGERVLKPKELQKWVVDLISQTVIFWRKFPAVCSNGWDFLISIYKNVHFLPALWGSLYILWHPCVAQELYIGEFWWDHLSDLAKSH